MEKRGFYYSNDAWYYQKNQNKHTDEIIFGVYFYREDGFDDGCVAEMSMRWYNLGGGELTPKLEIFHDAWKEFSKMKDLIEALSKFDSKPFTPQDFMKLLLKLGFEDRTKRESPYKKQEEEDAKKRKEILDAMPDEHKRILGLKL